MRIALDSNVLVYLAGLERTSADLAKVERARQIIRQLKARHDLVIATQAIGELYNVLTRKRGLTRDAAAAVARQVVAGLEAVATSTGVFDRALDLAVAHQFQIWDAVIVAGAESAGCDCLLSEDMHDGLVLNGLTIVNPFAASPHPRLAALLA